LSICKTKCNLFLLVTFALYIITDALFSIYRPCSINRQTEDICAPSAPQQLKLAKTLSSLRKSNILWVADGDALLLFLSLCTEVEV
jgi:hypothetical protein